MADPQEVAALLDAARAAPSDQRLCLSTARALRKLGARDAALQLLPLASDAPPLGLERVHLLRELGRLAEAEAALTVIAQRHPNHPDLPPARAALRESQGDFAAAAEAYGETLLHHPGHRGFTLKRVHCLRQAGQIAAAREALRPFAESSPGHPAVLEATVALAAGDPAAVAEACRRALDQPPQEPKLRARLLRALRQAGEPEAALALLPRENASPELLAEAIPALLALGRMAEARCACESGFARWPGHKALLLARAQLEDAAGDPEAAAAALSEALEGAPGDARLREALARRLNEAGRTDEALKLLDAGLSAEPDSAGLAFLRLDTLRLEGRWNDAQAALAEIARRHPAHPRLARAEGDLASEMGDDAAAVRAYRRALDAAPHSLPSRARLLRALRRRHELDAVLEVLRERPEARLELFHEYLTRGDWDAAEALVTGWDPQDPERLRAQARWAALHRDHARAIGLAEAILADAPGDAWAQHRLVESLTFSFQAERAHAAIRAAQAQAPGARRRPLRSGSGHIINEFRLRPRASQALAAAFGGPGEALARLAAAEIEADPDFTGAALGLLIGLDHAGALQPRPLAGAEVPRIIHQYWDRPEPPPDILALMQRLAALHPGHVHRRWDDAAARAFLQGRALAAYQAARHVAVRADILRLAVLAAEGGIYVDADDLARRPLDGLLPAGANLVLIQEERGAIGNNFLAAAPGKALLGEALDEACGAILGGATESPWLASGPGLLTRVLARAIARDAQLRLPEGVVVQPPRIYRQHVAAGRPASYKRSAANWARAL